MQTGAPRQTAQCEASKRESRLAPLEAALTAALEAAAGRASRQAQSIIQAARLATAVHMRRAAESVTAPMGHERTAGCLSRPAASTDPDVAARLARRGGRP